MKSVTTPTQLISATCLLCLVSLLSACEDAPTASPSNPATSGSVLWSLAQSEEANCFSERIVQPPRGAHKAKNGGARPVPSYFLEGPWVEYLDLESLSLKLNERDIDYSIDVGSGELQFTNPGKSRAVIDITYCLSDEIPDDSGDNDEPENDDIDEGGVIVVVDPCDVDLECSPIGF